jgi:hypothetical protein
MVRISLNPSCDWRGSEFKKRDVSECGPPSPQVYGLQFAIATSTTKVVDDDVTGFNTII